VEAALKYLKHGDLVNIASTLKKTFGLRDTELLDLLYGAWEENKSYEDSSGT
jgi:hypothetical protein